LTVSQGKDDVPTVAAIRTDASKYARIGHSPAIQQTSRLAADVVGRDGTTYPKGTAVPIRADFNTLDNPFYWSADPGRDGLSPEARAGLHFVVFKPHERRLPPKPAGHGRGAAGRPAAAAGAARPRPGVQLGADDHA
jgi:hypothetical protein